LELIQINHIRTSFEKFGTIFNKIKLIQSSWRLLVILNTKVLMIILQLVKSTRLITKALFAAIGNDYSKSILEESLALFAVDLFSLASSHVSLHLKRGETP